AHDLLKELRNFCFTLGQRGQVMGKGLFAAQRFPYAIRFDWAIIDPAAKGEKFQAELAELLDQFDSRISLQIATGVHPQLSQSLCRFRSDTPKPAPRQFQHEFRN